MEAVGDRVLYSYAQEKWTTNAYGSEELRDQYKFVEDDSLQILLREVLEEHNLQGREREYFEKLISKYGNDLIWVERVVRNMLDDLRGKFGSRKVENIISKLNNRGGETSSTTRERGLNIDASTLELKLERFKVKTVNAIGSGVVKEEPK